MLHGDPKEEASPLFYIALFAVFGMVDLLPQQLESVQRIPYADSTPWLLASAVHQAIFFSAAAI